MHETPIEKLLLKLGYKNINVTQIYAHITITGKDIGKGLKYSRAIGNPFRELMLKIYHEEFNDLFDSEEE